MSDEQLLARVSALEAIFKEDDFGSRLRELESEVAALKEKGPPVHTSRLDGHDQEIIDLKARDADKAEAILAIQNAFAIWQSATLQKFDLLDEKLAAMRVFFEGAFGQLMTKVSSTKAFIDNRDKALDGIHSSLKLIMKHMKLEAA